MKSMHPEVHRNRLGQLGNTDWYVTVGAALHFAARLRDAPSDWRGSSFVKKCRSSWRRETWVEYTGHSICTFGPKWSNLSENRQKSPYERVKRLPAARKTTQQPVSIPETSCRMHEEPAGILLAGGRGFQR